MIRQTDFVAALALALITGAAAAFAVGTTRGNHPAEIDGTPNTFSEGTHSREPILDIQQAKEIDPRTAIIGSWTWTHTAAGDEGDKRRKLTPESEGFTATLEFKKDGTFKYIKQTKDKKKDIVEGKYGVGYHEGSWILSFSESIDFLKKNAYLAMYDSTLEMNGAHDRMPNLIYYTRKKAE